MSFYAALEEVAALVNTTEFKKKQVAFFYKYCQEFDGSVEENKSRYTAIHKDYVQRVEKEIESVLGAEKLQLLCQGAEEHFGSGRAVQTQAGAEAIDLLASLADFESFKKVMLAKKAEQAANGVVLQDVKGVLDVDDVIDRTKDLREAAAEADGWALQVDDPNCVFYTKPGPGGAIYLRYTIELDLPAAEAFRMVTDFCPESEAWRDRMQSIKNLSDYAPNDKIVQYSIAIPWALKYIMSIPETAAMRIVTRNDWPSDGDHAYACLPFDTERNVCLEESGMMKLKTGVVSAHQADVKKSTLTGCDLVNLGMVPSWGLAFLLKKMTLPNLATMTENFKAVAVTSL